MRGLLDDIAVERIWIEFAGLLCGPYAVPVLREYHDIAFVIMAEMDRRLLVAVHYAVGLPVVHGGARGELDMQRIGHDFNVLASREPTGRLCPALSEREREIQQIARPCRNASTQASHGWRATRRAADRDCGKGSACHGRHNDRHPL